MIPILIEIIEIIIGVMKWVFTIPMLVEIESKWVIPKIGAENSFTSPAKRYGWK